MKHIISLFLLSLHTLLHGMAGGAAPMEIEAEQANIQQLRAHLQWAIPIIGIEEDTNTYIDRRLLEIKGGNQALPNDQPMIILSMHVIHQICCNPSVKTLLHMTGSDQAIQQRIPFVAQVIKGALTIENLLPQEYREILDQLQSEYNEYMELLAQME